MKKEKWIFKKQSNAHKIFFRAKRYTCMVFFKCLSLFDNNKFANKIV